MMTTKLQNYIQMAGQTAVQVTQNTENWTGFLTTASRLYRYPFPDQLMIHAQRPKATACAEYDLWNRRMSRYICRGSKGIGLVGISRSGYPKLRYVFDIADTGKRNEASNLFQWQYKEEYCGIVTKALEERFGLSGEKGLVYQIGLLSVGLANGCWKKHSMDIMRECEGSRLEGLGEQEASLKFRLATAASISYALLSRCGFDPWQYLKSEDLQDIPDFNTQRIIRILGAAVSHSSEKVVRTIAVAIYNHECQKQAVQDISQPAQPKGNDRDRQPSKDSVKKPEPVPVETLQKDDINELELVLTETVQEDDTEESKPATVETLQEDNTENEVLDKPEAEPASQELHPINYQVGDTVYLDGTAYEVTNIGRFDVQMRDPSQRYPIFRTENKDRLAVMLQRDSRNMKQPMPDKEAEVFQQIMKLWLNT